MTKKKKTKHNKAKEVGVGLIAAAALVAGASFLYGTDSGSKRRKQIKGWMLKAKGEVLEKLEKAKEINHDVYHKIVDQTVKKYQGLSNVDLSELTALKNDFKKHWKNIKRQIDKKETKKASSRGTSSGDLSRTRAKR